MRSSKQPASEAVVAEVATEEVDGHWWVVRFSLLFQHSGKKLSRKAEREPRLGLPGIGNFKCSLSLSLSPFGSSPCFIYVLLFLLCF